MKAKVNPPDVPAKEREVLFCDHWMKHRHDIKAATLAGYSNPKREGPKLKKRFIAYLSERMLKHDEEISKEIVYDQKDLLNEMASIGFANPLDYLVVEDAQDSEGKSIKRLSQKPLDQLTRKQAAAISDIVFCDGKVTYTIPNPGAKFQYLFSLAKNLGLFNDKLIMEHRHAHLHNVIDFKDVPQEQLVKLEDLLRIIVGDDAKKILGLNSEPK